MLILTPHKFKAFTLARSVPTGQVERRSGTAPLGVRKQSVETIEEAGDRKLRYVISTGAVDRDRDTIDPKGWKLDAYRKNPVVLWGHDGSSLPIGRAVDLEADGARLAATVSFIPPDGYGKAGEFAETVFALSRDGFLNATSVGFCPIEWDVTNDKARGADDWFPGIDFRSQELVEFSIVTVPSNPEALLEPAAPPSRAAEPTTTANQESTTQRAAKRSRRHVLELLELTGQ